MIPVPPGVKVEHIDPPAVDLVWEDRVVLDVPVEVGIVGAAASGFVVKGAPRPSPLSSTRDGPKSQVMVLQHAPPTRSTSLACPPASTRGSSPSTRPRHAFRYDVPSVSASGRSYARGGRATVCAKVPVAVVGRASAKAQPSEVDVRLSCPPEVVRALRPSKWCRGCRLPRRPTTGRTRSPVQVSDRPVYRARDAADRHRSLVSTGGPLRGPVLRARLFDAPVAKRDDARHARGQSGVVSHDDDGRAPLLVDGEKQVVDLRAGRGIEVARRFVGEEELWLEDDGASQRHALLLAPGQLARDGAGCDREGPPPRAGLGPAARFRALDRPRTIPGIADVLERVELREAGGETETRIRQSGSAAPPGESPSSV
jgi:hypothetical protein